MDIARCVRITNRNIANRGFLNFLLNDNSVGLHASHFHVLTRRENKTARFPHYVTRQIFFVFSNRLFRCVVNDNHFQGHTINRKTNGVVVSVGKEQGLCVNPLSCESCSPNVEERIARVALEFHKHALHRIVVVHSCTDCEFIRADSRILQREVEFGFFVSIFAYLNNAGVVFRVRKVRPKHFCFFKAFACHVIVFCISIRNGFVVFVGNVVFVQSNVVNFYPNICGIVRFQITRLRMQNDDTKVFVITIFIYVLEAYVLPRSTLNRSYNVVNGRLCKACVYKLEDHQITGISRELQIQFQILFGKRNPVFNLKMCVVRPVVLRIVCIALPRCRGVSLYNETPVAVFRLFCFVNRYRCRILRENALTIVRNIVYFVVRQNALYPKHERTFSRTACVGKLVSDFIVAYVLESVFRQAVEGNHFFPAQKRCGNCLERILIILCNHVERFL